MLDIKPVKSKEKEESQGLDVAHGETPSEKVTPEFQKHLDEAFEALWPKASVAHA